MESPKFDIIAQGLSFTKSLIERMEINMRTQLSKDNDFLDSLSTRRENSLHTSQEPPNQSTDPKPKQTATPLNQFKSAPYQTAAELENELESYRYRLTILDEPNPKPLTYDCSINEIEREPVRDFKKFKESDESIKDDGQSASFNERKYQLEIQILRDELEKLRKSKRSLEGDLKEMKKIGSKTPKKHGINESLRKTPFRR